MTFEQSLKKSRKEIGISQEELSLRAEIPKRTIEEWERGARIPPMYIQRYVLSHLSFIKKNLGTSFPVYFANIIDPGSSMPKMLAFDTEQRRDEYVALNPTATAGLSTTLDAWDYFKYVIQGAE